MPANLVVQMITIPLWRNNKTGTALQNIGPQSICLVHFVYTNNRRTSVIFWLIAAALVWDVTAVEHSFFSHIQATYSSAYAPSKWHGTDDFCSAARWKSFRSLSDKSRAGVASQPSKPPTRFASCSPIQEEHDPSSQNLSSAKPMPLIEF